MSRPFGKRNAVGKNNSVQEVSFSNPMGETRQGVGGIKRQGR